MEKIYVLKSGAMFGFKNRFNKWRISFLSDQQKLGLSRDQSPHPLETWEIDSIDNNMAGYFTHQFAKG